MPQQPASLAFESLIEQPLYEAVFGLTFVAVDPDDHRLRVCMPD
ncbi:hypothetical protein [Pseudomonas alabamensis]